MNELKTKPAYEFLSGIYINETFAVIFIYSKGPSSRALLNTGTERNIPEYAGMRRNEQEWYRNIPKRAGKAPE